MNPSDSTDLVRHSYDAVSHRYRRDDDNPAEYTPWLTSLQRRLPPRASVLDLGCGCGIPVAKTLTDDGQHVTGVDLSEVQIKRACHLVPQAISCTPMPPRYPSPTGPSTRSSASTHSSTCHSTRNHS